MKKTFIFFLGIALSFTCCKKENSKDVLMDNFVKSMKTNASKMDTSAVSLVRTEKTGNNEITLSFNTPLSEDQMQPQLISSAVQDIMIKIIRKDPKNIQLLDKGVNFKVVLTGKNGKKLYSDIINKSSMSAKKPDTSVNIKHSQLNQMLEISNGNLPIVDSATGIKITKIALGNHNDVIYTAEVPKSIENMVKMEENRSIIKSNMAKDKQFKQMLKDLKAYDISSLKYQYRNQNGKLLQEIEMKENDFIK